MILNIVNGYLQQRQSISVATVYNNCVTPCSGDRSYKRSLNSGLGMQTSPPLNGWCWKRRHGFRRQYWVAAVVKSLDTKWDAGGCLNSEKMDVT